MGILDFPTPLFAWVDARAFAGLAPPARLALWALAISALSIGLYALLSPQAELRALKGRLREARRELRAWEGDFGGLMGLARRNVALSLRHFRLVAPAALTACIPVILLMIWLAKTWTFAAPESGLPLAMQVTGGAARLDIVESGGGAHGGTMTLVILLNDGRTIMRTDLRPEVARIEKRDWRHGIIGNPGGYLPPDAPIEAVSLRWPRREFHDFGPAWLRGWETPFLTLALVFTLAIQAAFRIE